MTAIYFNPRNLLIACLMFMVAGVAVAMTPSIRIADQGDKVVLDVLIPSQFGNWKVDEAVSYQQVSPDVKAAIDKIYNQVLTRTYVNREGYRIMLTVPYGADQSDGLSAHDPEGCYPAQGFQIMSKSKEVIRTTAGDIPVRRMHATSGARNEPVTYWFTVGSKAVNDDWERKKTQLRYTLKGQIPDGLLFRVSSIDPDTEQAYAVQASFINDLVGSLTPEARLRVAGLSQ